LWGIRGKVGGKKWGTQKKHLDKKKEADKPFSSTVRIGTGGLRVARGGSGAKLAARLVPHQWVLKRRELPGFARVNKATSASLGYPLSVFNKTSTLTRTLLREDTVTTLKVTLCLSYRVGGQNGLGATLLGSLGD